MRFGLMHVLSCNLGVWLRVLVVEVVESIIHSEHAEAHTALSPGMVVVLRESVSCTGGGEGGSSVHCLCIEC